MRPDTLETIRSLVVDLQDTDGVRAVDSLYSARRKVRVGRYLLPLIPPPSANQERFESARREIAEHPYVVGHLLSADGNERIGQGVLGDLALVVVGLRSAGGCEGKCKHDDNEGRKIRAAHGEVLLAIPVPVHGAGTWQSSCLWSRGSSCRIPPF